MAQTEVRAPFAIRTRASDPLSFAKVSGPAWLNVATNGVLSGTPTNSDIGSEIFVVSLIDTNGVSATANIIIPVIPDPPATFVHNPFAEPWVNVDEAYSAAIATNATDPELAHGDILTFGKISGAAWLTVASSGMLSGTPEDVNAGSNIFTVGVTNIAGVSTNAALIIYVNSPPSFSPGDFTKPAATVGIPYSGTLAANATDPDLGAGDVLTYYKVTGPAWLNVSTNGSLSGVPASTNLGVNAFLVLVIDSGGLSAIGYMDITVNTYTAPSFISNPFAGPPATAGSIYTASIVTNTSDPDFGDTLTFSKISGPGWLGVASNGGLSGTPASSNVGTNTFIVSMIDLGGTSNNATMSVNVLPPPPIVLKLSSHIANTFMLSWVGGIPPYQPMLRTNVNSPWQNIGISSYATNVTVSATRPRAFFQVQGQ